MHDVIIYSGYNGRFLENDFLSTNLLTLKPVKKGYHDGFPVLIPGPGNSYFQGHRADIHKFSVANFEDVYHTTCYIYTHMVHCKCQSMLKKLKQILEFYLTYLTWETDTPIIVFNFRVQLNLELLIVITLISKSYQVKVHENDFTENELRI